MTSHPTHRRALLGLVAAAFGLGLGGCSYTGAEPACTDAGAADTWATQGQPFFDQYCVRCHSGELDGWYRQGAPAGRDFDTWANADDSMGHTREGRLGEVWEVLAEGEMPPMLWVRPSQAEMRAFGEWLACGHPE